MRVLLDIEIIASELEVSPEIVKKWIKKGIIIESYAPKGATKKRIPAESISEPSARVIEAVCNFYFTLRSVIDENEEADPTGAKIIKFRPLKAAKGPTKARAN